MLTRLITSQHDHGGYLCMGIDNSLSLQELTSPSSLTPAGKTLESLARETTPPGLPSFLSLSFSPFSHFTHPQPDGLLTEMESESQAQLSQQHPPVKNLAPWRHSFKLIYKRMVSGHQPMLCVYRTAFAWSQLQQRQCRQWQRTYTRGDQRHWRLKKNDRDRNTLTTGNSSRVHSLQVVNSRQNLDANQSN